MKAFKSMVLLTVGVLAISACDKRSDNQTTSTRTQDTTMGAGAANDPNANGMMNSAATTQSTTEGTATDQGSGTGTAVGAGTGAAATQDDFSSTSDGSGAISDDAELNSDYENFEDEDLSGSEVQEEEYAPATQGTGSGTERFGDNYESVDESSSEPDDVRGGRDARMLPKHNEIDNTSSEPDLQQ